jgi:hypothetical protein
VHAGRHLSLTHRGNATAGLHQGLNRDIRPSRIAARLVETEDEGSRTEAPRETAGLAPLYPAIMRAPHFYPDSLDGTVLEWYRRIRVQMRKTEFCLPG